MPSTRALMLRHPVLVATLLFCALIVRVLVPAGYMPVAGGGALMLQLCPGTAPAAAAPMAGMHHDGAKHDAPGKAEQPCAFAGLAAPALGSTDPALLLAALAFVLLLAISGGVLTIPAPPSHLRPPLRAPPLPA